jgi:hypothetical protein
MDMTEWLADKNLKDNKKENFLENKKSKHCHVSKSWHPSAFAKATADRAAPRYAAPKGPFPDDGNLAFRSARMCDG